MDLGVLIKLNMLILMSFLCLAARADSSRSVVFFDTPDQRYLRNHPSRAGDELDEVLLPNPFDRPRAVLMLEVRGIEGPLSIDNTNFQVGSTFNSRVLGSSEAEIQLPDEDEVAVVTLDEPLGPECDAVCVDKELGDIAQLLGDLMLAAWNHWMGSWLSLCPVKSDREFALGLASLIRSIKKAVETHDDFAGSIKNPAELLMGRYTGIEILKEEYGLGDITLQGVELFQTALTKLFDQLRFSYKGRIVGVILFNKEASPDSRSMVDVKFSTRFSRWLEEAGPSNAFHPEVLLVRRSLAWITGIILLISTLIGVYFLLNMPLTRDTLLYSNVKLD